MTSGETKSLDIAGLDGDFTWESQYETVAVISDDGQIVAKGPGKTTITIKVGDKEYYFVVVVKGGNGSADSEDSNTDKTDGNETEDTGSEDGNSGKESDKTDDGTSGGKTSTDKSGTPTLTGGSNGGTTTTAPAPDDDPDDEENTELTGAEKRQKEREQAGTDTGKDSATQAKIPQNKQPVLYVDDASAKAGEKGVKLAVKVLRNPGILGMSFAVRFDEKVLTLTKAENGSALKDVLDLTAGKKLKNGCKFAWDGVEISSDQIKDGDVLVLTFDVASGAKAGVHAVTITCDDGDVVNGKLVPVDIQLVGGGITVK